MLRTRRSRRLTALAAAAVLALTLTACAPEDEPAVTLPQQVDAALPEATQTELRAAVEHAMAATASSGAIAGVWAPWAGTWVAGLGTTAVDGAEVTPDMTFKAGSVTRAMTCDVLYALAADGTVALGDPVTEWVSGVPDLGAVTLEQLCDGTSGLAGYGGRIFGRWIANPERVWSPRELLAYGMSAGLAFEPGSAYLDSDTGYVLLGLALERASGKRAAELFQEYVFEPVGMAASSLPAGSPADASTLPGHRSGDANGAVDCATPPLDLTGLSASAGFTADGVLTNVTDLGRYVQSLATGARSYDVDARFEEPRAPGAEAPSWFTVDGGTYQAGSLVGQYGSFPGYLTAAFADRQTGMAVVVVLNNSRGSADAVRATAWQLAAIASKAPAAAGQAAPEAGLPWTAESVLPDIDNATVCPAS